MKIALLSMMRLSSTRLDKKLLHKVGHVPIATRALETLKKVRGGNTEVIAAICPTDESLLTLADRSGVRLLFRSKDSAAAHFWEECFDPHLKQSLQDEFVWVIAVNASMPFLTERTIEKAIIKINEQETSSFQTAYRERGPVWDHRGRRLPQVGLNPLYYTSCSAIYSYPVADLAIREGMEIRSILPVQRGPEFLEVTNREDLKIAQAWARTLRGSDGQAKS